jgi:peptide/nickel transport system ATP-binding protein
VSELREPVLEVRDLRVALDDGTTVVEGVDLALRPGEIVGVVGESGSGKTTTAIALLGFERPGSAIAGGSVRVGGTELLDLPERERRRLRGRTISYVPQDAAQALNPSLRIADAIGDLLREHGVGDDDERVLRALRAVDLPATEAFARRLPHQFSGGQQQRITIAMALACEPLVVVMDEPTTGLDVITQASVLAEVRRLRDEQGAAVVYVSHDLAVVSEIADRIAVMYAGRVVEDGPAADVLTRPRHPYTRGLVQSIPDHRRPSRLVPLPGTAVGLGDRPGGCAFAPRCEQAAEDCRATVPALAQAAPSHAVRCLRWERTPAVRLGEPRTARPQGERDALLDVRGLRATHRSGRETVVAADDVGFSIAAGECLALVGQSGSGKTTIARCIAGLHRPDRGTIALGGEPLAARAQRRSREQRRRLQYVFQNPFESLNPRRTVAEALARPARLLRGLSAAEARAEVAELLEQVRLPARLADSYPGRLSGGERQRVAVARALAARPDLIVCDEITSALDVSVQAAVLEVLAELRAELGVAMLLITHDLGVVAATADEVVVVAGGRIHESGPVAAVLADPADEYTRRLVAAAPRIARESERYVS